jgi:hypothetical protein
VPRAHRLQHHRRGRPAELAGAARAGEAYGGVPWRCATDQRLVFRLLAAAPNDPAGAWLHDRHADRPGARRIDARPNWREQPPRESLAGVQWR